MFLKFSGRKPIHKKKISRGKYPRPLIVWPDDDRAICINIRKKGERERDTVDESVFITFFFQNLD